MLADQHFGDYDVLCLQECFVTWTLRGKSLLRLCRDLGFLYVAVPMAPPMLSCKMMDSGLFIISRYPIVEVRQEMFTDAVYSDRLAAKGIQHARIMVGQVVVNMINSHVQSDYRIEDPLATRVKIRQWQQIKAFVERHTPPSEDVIVCGDLNCNAITWSDDLVPDEGIPSAIYGDMMHCFGLGADTDMIRNFSNYRRPPTTYSTYDEKRIEIDTERRQEDDPDLVRGGWVCLPRSVDYILQFKSLCLRPIAAGVVNLDCAGQPFRALSDHSAVSAILSYE